MLEVVSGAGTAQRGAVEVSNPGDTQGTLPESFDYYVPRVASLRIVPGRDTVAPGRTAQFAAECIDQFNHPINTPVQWKVTGGRVAATGQYTAPDRAGIGMLEARAGEPGVSARAVITVGTADLTDGRLRQWLILGPFPDPDYTALTTALIPEETVLPSHSDQVGTLTWSGLDAKEDLVDFFARFTPNTNAVAYAHVYLYAPITTACTLLFGSDDGMRIWLNGAQLFSLRTRRPADPNQNRLPITLKQGWNRLLVKVDQGTGAWGCYLRLLTPDGRPLNGILYTLDRPNSGL
jgi:hypothetical protein